MAVVRNKAELVLPPLPERTVQEAVLSESGRIIL
jgi:hypothetical protein